jgi:hypothetical protein
MVRNFVNEKRTKPFPYSFLSEHNGTWRVELNGESREKQQWGEQDKPNKRDPDVKCALYQRRFCLTTLRTAPMTLSTSDSVILG